MAQIAHSDDMRLKLELAGSGFRDFTRIAGSSSAIWSDIFLNNRSALLRELDTWQLLLANVKSMLEHQQTDTLRHVLDEAAALRQTWQKLDTADTTDTKLLQQDMPSLPQRSAQQSTCATTAHGKPSAPTAIAVGTVAHKLDRSTIKMPRLQQVKGNITLPGSKSISNRVLLLAALSKGTTLVRSVLQAEDTHVMLTALKQLGVEYIRQGDSNDYLIQGTAGRFPNQQARLFMGNAGTAIRPLTAVLAIQGGAYELSGVARMHERPINDLVEGLRQLGCNIDYLQQTGYPPITIGMRHPSPIPHTIQINGNTSSQFTTALLMALPLLSAHLQHAITVEIMGELISKPYIALTLNLLERFGVEVIQQGWSSFTIPAQASYASPGDITVEGDASSASYFLAAGAIGQGPVRVNGIGTDSIQGDVQFAQALQQMGAQISMDNLSITASAPTVGKLRAIDLDCNAIPDAAMTLAMCALFAEGTTTLRNIASWRVKETDRIHAMATELGKLGALIESGPDFIRITPPQIWRPPIQGIDTYDDHRIAMCFSLAAFAPVPITINHPECVTKTFPDYFATFASLY
jgi:3-phosphoshikimate 1-carboxyvinyltransferase